MDQKFGEPENSETRRLMQWVETQQSLAANDPALEEHRKFAANLQLVAEPPAVLAQAKS